MSGEWTTSDETSTSNTTHQSIQSTTCTSPSLIQDTSSYYSQDISSSRVSTVKGSLQCFSGFNSNRENGKLNKVIISIFNYCNL